MDDLVLYLSVVFIDKPKTHYWYISDDLSVNIGDYVCVQVDDCIKVCKVVSKCMYSKENAPYPYENTKHIISKMDTGSIIKYILCPNVKMFERYNDCGFYDSISFTAKELSIPVHYDVLTIEEKVIKEAHHVKIIKEFVLPDDCSQAFLYRRQEFMDYDYDGNECGSFVHYDGVTCDTLIIPKGYNYVNLHSLETNNLFISNGVAEIELPINNNSKLSTLYIPKDLDYIKTDFSIFERIVLDPNNKHYKFENGVLYYVNNNNKHIIWVSKKVTRLTISSDIDALLYIRSDIELVIDDNSF